MSKWIAEFDLEDSDTLPEHMDLEYKEAKLDFHCRPMWIPVTERLPDKSGENVIVSIHDDSGDYASFGWYAVKGKFWVVDNEVNERVVAWLPLPIPYRKGGQE